MPQPGDRVIANRERISLALAKRLEDDGVPFGTAGEVIEVRESLLYGLNIEAPVVATVEFPDVTVQVPEAALEVLTSNEERMQARRKMAQQSRLSKMATRASGYFTPETVEQSFDYGRREGYAGRPKLKLRQFLVTIGDHGFPDSLWKAYTKGYAKGKQERRKHAPDC